MVSDYIKSICKSFDNKKSKIQDTVVVYIYKKKYFYVYRKLNTKVN